MKIAFSGTHGTGKTTAAFELALYYKQKTNSDVYLVQEVARRCPFPINTGANIKTHLWIFAEQIKQELEAEKSHNMIVCDRTIADTVAYAKYLGMDDLVSALMPALKYHIKSYDRIIVRTSSKYSYVIDDGVRDVSNNEFRKGVEETLLNFYLSLRANVEVD
jgi:cytidylate kinase